MGAGIGFWIVVVVSVGSVFFVVVCVGPFAIAAVFILLTDAMDTCVFVGNLSNVFFE